MIVETDGHAHSVLMSFKGGDVLWLEHAPYLALSFNPVWGSVRFFIRRHIQLTVGVYRRDDAFLGALSFGNVSVILMLADIGVDDGDVCWFENDD